MSKQKQTGNQNGTQLELFVQKVLEDQEYQLIENNKFLLASNILEQKLYTRQLNVCESIFSIGDYVHKTNADFVIYNPATKEKYLIIECKSQTSNGSTDEKVVYLNENIKQKYPFKTIAIIDAPKFKKGARLWLKEQEKHNSKLSVFLDFSEFRAWAIKKL
jgi:hypothetical protein